jgi:hypothetical protein
MDMIQWIIFGSIMFFVFVLGVFCGWVMDDYEEKGKNPK